MDNCLAVDPTGVACCNHGADCGAAGTVEMPDWDVSLVTSMSELFNGKGQFNADISRWDTSSVTTMYMMFYRAYAFNQHLSRWDVSSVTYMRYMFYDANAFNKMPVGWDTSKVTDSYWIFYSAAAWYARFEGGGDDTLPGGGWTRKDNACDASLPPVNGDVGTCTDTLVSGTSCVPECDAGYVRQGVTSCTNRVLTEVATCGSPFTDRAELKAAVDACVGDRLCEMTMPYWDVSRVTDMSFLFQGKTQFNVDIGQWEMSQVTDAQGMFHGASSFYQNIKGWTLANNANTTGMFTGADTWLFRAYRRGWHLTRQTGRRTRGPSKRAWRTNALSSERANAARDVDLEPPETTLHRATHRVRFPTATR